MVKQTPLKLNLIVITLVIIVLLNIFHSKLILPHLYTTTNNQDVLLSINASGLKCLQQQNHIQKQIEGHCSKVQIKDEKVEETVITTEKTNQLGYCHVPKVASSSWMLAFAEMNNLDKNVIDDLHKKMALHGMLMTNFSIPVRNVKDIEDMNNSNLYKFIFIRHPFERLVSAFHDKFEHTKQGAMMLPFLKHEVIKYMMRSLKKQKSPKSSSLPFDIDLSFENFINFVLEEATYTVISEQSKHWWPYSDLCKMCKIKYNFIGSLETLNEDVSCMLKNFKNYALLQKMEDRVRKKINAGGEHTKAMTMDYFSKLSKQTIQKLYELYKVDFILGNYKFPQEYIDMGKP